MNVGMVVNLLKEHFKKKQHGLGEFVKLKRQLKDKEGENGS